MRIPFRSDYRVSFGLPESTRRDIEAFAPDIVHLSAPDALGWSALKLGRQLNVPVVASLHTLFDSYLDYYGLAWLRPLARRQLWKFYGACDYVMPPTAAIAEELRAHAPSTQARVWGRGVDHELFRPERRDPSWRVVAGFDQDRPVIVFLGRIVMEKGLKAFAGAIAQLKAMGHEPQVLVIGDGPARAWFEAQLPGAVFTGLLTGEPLARALASGDIFLNPSNTETFGNVNLEAMACGLAMVCADAPNTRALLRHGHDALLCAPDQPSSYASAIAGLIADEHERRRMAAEALRRSADYRWSKILEDVAEVYAEALDRHARPVAAWRRAPHSTPPSRSGHVEPEPNGLTVP
ncbi:glycosyltransferase involved in cell wall biosynthesis [Caulobacter segnis]|nr:glycosyltransferase involved in cell wall biosynthesis [Caulobacter segnis]